MLKSEQVLLQTSVAAGLLCRGKQVLISKRAAGIHPPAIMGKQEILQTYPETLCIKALTQVL